ncbi:MAG: IclR family transcriptional regulator [Dehalococcoidales bacterium]
MKSLFKVLDILELFWHHQDEMSLAEISGLSGYNKATVYRIVSTLVKRGYLRQAMKRGKYSLGNVFLEFSGIIKKGIEIRDVAIPYITELSQFARESVIIAVWDGKDGVLTETFHEVSHATGPLKVIPEEGISIPLHCTCSGKIILANMTEEELKKYYSNRQLERRTPNTIIDILELKKQLMIIQQVDIAYDDEEYALGVRGVASGLRNDQGKIVGAINVVGPSVRLSFPMLKNMAPTVQKYAMRISRELGYQGKGITKT